MTAGAVFVDPKGQKITLGEVGQRILSENDYVRIWEVDLQPGESHPWHEHHLHYLVLALEGSDNRIDFLDGSPSRFVTEVPGGYVFRELGERHMLTNIGNARYRSRLIELKQTGSEQQ